MADSVFTKIIKGEIPSHKIYEDDFTYAFLDIEPLTPGHVLVVPKKQVDQLWDLDDESYNRVMATAKKVAIRIREVLKPPRVGMSLEGFAVPHVHVHVFPLYKGLVPTTIDFAQKSKGEPDQKDLAEMAQKLAF